MASQPRTDADREAAADRDGGQREVAPTGERSRTCRGPVSCERHYLNTRVDVGGAYQAFSLDGLEVGGTGGDGEGGCWLLQDAREQLQADRCSSNLLCKLLCSCLPCRLHRHTRVLGVSRAYQAFSLARLGVGGIDGGSEGGG